VSLGFRVGVGDLDAILLTDKLVVSANARCANLRNRDHRRARRGTGARGPRGPPGREDHLAAGNLCVAPRGALGF